MRFRQVHLDFHTSEHIPAVGGRFDKAQFQQMLKEGHVDSITVFSKCHHGWSYHPTRTNEMHPTLAFDLLKAQIEACHEIGVNAPGYISAGYDEKYARQHPEHLLRSTPDAEPDFSVPHYKLICLNTPYLDVLEAQVTEMCANYDVDGVFLDIVAPRVCYCEQCLRSMKALGINPEDPAAVRSFGETVYENYTKRMRAAVDRVKPGLPIYHNAGKTPAGRRDLEFMNSHVEIESLPTGGWGYDNLPMIARYVQSHGRDYLGMTGKFHLSWGEFGGYKHTNALIYETARAVAHGAKCSVGDQLHPSGVMDPETYRIIGEAYRLIEEKEPWLEDVTAVADVGLLSCAAWALRHPEVENVDASRCDTGALRILLEGHYLFDILDEESDFSPYKVLVLPDRITVDGILKEKLDAYVAGGGKLLATGLSGLAGNEFAYDLGVTYTGPSEFQPTYLSLSAPWGDCGPADYVLNAPSQVVNLSDGGEALAGMRYPYFNRTAEHFCSHRHAPVSPESSTVGIALGKNGGYIANAIFSEYADVGCKIAKQAVCSLLDRLLGTEKTVEIQVCGGADVTLMEQRALRRQMLHLVYAPRMTKGSKKIEVIEDCVPLYDIPVSLRVDRPVVSVSAVPSGDPLPFRQEDGRIFFTVPKVEIHAVICIAFGE